MRLVRKTKPGSAEPQLAVASSNADVPAQWIQEKRELERHLSLIEALYHEAHRVAISERAKSSWLYNVAVELARPSSGWKRWIPLAIHQKLVDKRLVRFGIFNGDDYLLRYPDVARNRLSPIYHYLAHGMVEGRDGGPQTTATVETEPDIDAIPAILGSGLFDAEWYRERYGIAGTDAELVEDFLRSSAKDALRQPGPLFSCAFYGLENPDTRVTNALSHYVRYGMREGRRAFQASAADMFMSQSPAQTLPTWKDFVDSKKETLVLCWDNGNFFFTDIAKYLVETINSSGLVAKLSHDHRDIDTSLYNIFVVAPHEYCVHGPGVEFTHDLATRAVHVNLEQWHTSWFSLALDKMLVSKKALDINPLSARGLNRFGIQAGFLPLLPKQGGVFEVSSAPLSKQLSDLRYVKPLTYADDILDRTYDVLFVGYLNQRRSRGLAGLAKTLSDYDNFLHAPRFNGPMKPENPNMIGNRDLAQLAQNSKILLNIHQGDSHYFEWHRLVVSGIAQGCVPLSEPCANIGVVRPGEHYIESTLDEMPKKLSWLLGSSAGKRELQRIQENGRKLMQQLKTDHFDL